MGSSSPENRRHSRFLVNREFHSIEDFISEYVTNVSKGGVFVKSKSPLATGTKVLLRFTVLMDEIETIEGEGEVMWSNHGAEEQSGMGVAFTQLTPTSQRLLEKLLNRG